MSHVLLWLGYGSWTSGSVQECPYWKDLDSKGMFSSVTSTPTNYSKNLQDEETTLPKLFYVKVHVGPAKYEVFSSLTKK